MKSLLQDYSNANPEKFNEEMINLKESDNILSHIESIFKGLECINGVKFLGCELVTKEDEFPEYTKDDFHLVPIAPSRFILIKYKFKIWDDETGEEEIIDKHLYYPKLLDGTYFLLNGNRFFPIYQIIDSATYNLSGALILKSLFMAVTIRSVKTEYTDCDGNEYSGDYKIIDLFKNKLNYLYYFYPEFGFRESINFMINGKLKDDDILFCEEQDIENSDYDNYIKFKLGKRKNKTILLIKKSFYKRYKNFMPNLVESLIGKTQFEINNKDYWIVSLGNVYSKNKNQYEQKGKDILISFKRILDNSTKNNLRVKEENKENIYSVIRWMVKNFTRLSQQDNMELKYKRIRINEYLLHDLLLKFSNATYTSLNKQVINMKDRKQIFSNISPMFIVKKISTNDLLRYFNGVNAIELFNPRLKFSQRGFQSLGEGSRDVNKMYRGLHPSYIGRIGLTTASASDPGMSGTFTPFCKNEGFYFSDIMLDENDEEEF